MGSFLLRGCLIGRSNVIALDVLKWPVEAMQGN